MAIMKNFGVWLAQCVHKQKMSDEEILSSAKVLYKLTDKDFDWLKEQIAAVNADPYWIRVSQHSN